MTERTVDIVGAGLAGLSAALAARARGATVTVYEKRSDVGARFHGDFQGLENWSSETNVLTELEGFGINTDFEQTPVFEVVCFDPDGRRYKVQASEPIFYLVRRGNEEGTLDHSLKQQALDAGIIIRFGHRLRHISDGVVAEGPHCADMIATGYVFDTDMADGCYVAVDNQLAPAGYSYLLINHGRGTVATCFTEYFHNERQFVDSTVSFFQRKVGLRWQNAKRFGGSGNYQRVQNAVIGNQLYAGEAAGFQDALFGFGLQYALISGQLAGRADGSASAYEQQRQARLSGLNATSVFNRWVYERLGNRAFKFLMKHIVARSDPRHLLHRIYTPAKWVTKLAHRLPNRQLLQHCHPQDNCDCTWCRCHRHSHVSVE